jgi:hypothetical protein
VSSLLSNASSYLSSLIEKMDQEMADSIMKLKDTNGDGSLSASELGVTSDQLSQLDTDGDGVVSSSELTSGLASERQSMMAQSGGAMPPPPPSDASSTEGTDSSDSSTSAAGSTSAASSTSSTSSASRDSQSIDAMMERMFSSSSSSSLSSSSSSSSSTSLGSSVLSDYLARQKASSAYQSMDNLIAGLFDGDAMSQSVSLSA